MMKHKIEGLFKGGRVTGVSFDSRDVKSGDAFFAITGENFDGNEYIDEALKNGASIVFTDNAAKKNDNIEFIEDVRMGLAIAAGAMYQNVPKNLVAVTGTNGKSSVVSYVHQILSKLNQKSACIGTLGVESSEVLSGELAMWQQNALTTSDPITFRKILSSLYDENIENVAFEASSHGLFQRRLGDIKVKTAAFTSFSQDHLEYHKTMDSYLRAKLILFTENLENGGEAIINSETMFFDFIKSFLIENRVPYCTVGRKKSDIEIINNQTSLDGQKIVFKYKDSKFEFKTDIIGSFQAINLLIAAKLVHNLGFEFSEIVDKLPGIEAVAGRLQRITDSKHEFQVFVDYAHTPDALQKSLKELADLKKKSGNLYVVFGCGGDRDTLKRPIMGKIASEIADVVIITDDNPRTEDPRKIRAQIAEAAVESEEIADRKEAIMHSVSRLRKDDILLIAGKGHENYQIIGKESVKFSDIEIAKLALTKVVKK
jgi:UDP-N-acetylmuramoyl-L-alanyl-D-glutamate--2,6-diaminopimelate ligase